MSDQLSEGFLGWILLLLGKREDRYERSTRRGELNVFPIDESNWAHNINDMIQQRHLTHLYWRAGFGLSPQEWTIRQQWSIDKSVNALFAEAEKTAPLDDHLMRQIPDEAIIKKRDPLERKKLRKKRS